MKVVSWSISVELSQELILMKIVVSNIMMRNYQKDELPEIRRLENLNKAYDALLEAGKEFSQWN